MAISSCLYLRLGNYQDSKSKLVSHWGQDSMERCTMGGG
ncbi:hypothetical protein GBAR_LOCUS11621 [Geodia barretti]|uniref:Uncharacterized protein n=1 Tax=Geodia barretti TaxID=519541 RepID=A0AA35RX04_GEOBA|nr:hypothetical protein GBAR_LOCUS11621 [Geodia barretti]